MRHHISLSLDDLRTVVALAEELNYHRAARRVGKTQSGVTRAVARVERHVGTRLFERSHSKNHSVSTTDAGILYVARARLAIAHSESADLAARDSLHGVTHRISVGKSVFTDRRLLTILRSIELPLHPGLEVLLHTRSPAELPACVRSGEFDLAIVSNSVEDSLLSGTIVRCVPFTAMLDEKRLSVLIRQHGMGKVREDAAPAKLLASFLSKSEESKLGRILVEAAILLSMHNQTDAAKVLRGAAHAYKVDVDAISATVKQEFAAKEKGRTTKKVAPKPTVKQVKATKKQAAA